MKAGDAIQGLVDEWDMAHSWHPFTQMREYGEMPRVHIERGEGCWLYDIDGNRYLDGNASVWTNVHGHGDAELNAALKEQIDRLSHSTYLGLSHLPGAGLGRLLAEISPEPLRRAVFSDNGSNAVEIALKLSFQYWQLVGQSQRTLVVGMEGGYHGDTFGTMSAGDSGSFHARFSNWFFESRKFPAPLHVECNGKVSESSDERSLSALERILDEEGERVAVVVMEPWIQGAAGMRLQPKGFLKKVESLCRAYGVHLALDEVFVGFGRLGSMFVCEQEQVAPDFLCLAKGITAGYLPLAATLTTNRIYDAFLGDFASGNAFFHGHTFGANPLAATVAAKSIEKLSKLIESKELARRIAYFGEAIERAFMGHDCVKGVRQRGLAAAIDLCPRNEPGETWPVNDRMGLRVCLAARKRGLLLRPLLDSLFIVPPLIISDEEIDFSINAVLASIEETLE